MSNASSHPPHCPRLVWQAALALALAGGCSEQPISRYSAPKDPPLPKWATDDSPRVRMLVAMVPHADHVWFFKFVGADGVVTAQMDNFDQFVRSIQFKDNGQQRASVDWKLPAGWQEDAGNASSLNLATIRAGEGDGAAQMTVTALDSKANKASDVTANVVRWRTQLGWTGQDGAPMPVSAGDLDQYAAAQTLPCGKATLIDLISVPLPPRDRQPPPGHPPVAEQNRSAMPRVEYDLPSGWKVSEEPARMALVTLTAGLADRAAQATVSAMPGAAGGLLPNINRWRGQVGLEPVGMEEVKKSARRMTIDGQPAAGFQFVGAEADAGKRKAILAVLVPRDGMTWFVKLFGPAETVLAEAKAFDKFVESIRFKEEASTDQPKP